MNPIVFLALILMLVVGFVGVVILLEYIDVALRNNPTFRVCYFDKDEYPKRYWVEERFLFFFYRKITKKRVGDIEFKYKPNEVGHKAVDAFVSDVIIATKALHEKKRKPKVVVESRHWIRY